MVCNTFFNVVSLLTRCVNHCYNLMSVEIMEQLGLTQLKPISLVLKVVDQSQESPMGVLLTMHIIIAIIEYKIDYIVFKLLTSTFSYPILLGKLWLYQTKARNDWGKGTLILGWHENKIILQM